jgi:hypothetical protein
MMEMAILQHRRVSECEARRRRVVSSMEKVTAGTLGKPACGGMIGLVVRQLLKWCERCWGWLWRSRAVRLAEARS